MSLSSVVGCQTQLPSFYRPMFFRSRSSCQQRMSLDLFVCRHLYDLSCAVNRHTHGHVCETRRQNRPTWPLTTVLQRVTNVRITKCILLT